MIKNKRLIGLIAIATGFFMVVVFSKENFFYFNTIFNGTTTTATITSYKRINNNGKGQPAFTFIANKNEQINTICKTSLPNFMNKTSSRYFTQGQNICIAYLPQNPTAAVIISWSTWLFNILYAAVGLLFVYIGIGLILKKNKNEKMKKVLLLITIIICSLCSIAQKNKESAMKVIEQLRKPSGSISTTIDGKTFTEKAVIAQLPSGNYLVSADVVSQKNSINISLPKIISGSYPFSQNSKEITLFILQNGDMYQVNTGTIILKNTGTIAATFSGTAQKFIGKKGNLKPGGPALPFKGKFSGIKL